MLHTLLGPEKFRAGSDLYFAQHDGHAATCDDFVAAMAEASGIDLTGFKLWYSQAGTPRLRATMTSDGGNAKVTLAQSTPPTPGQPVKRPMTMPVKIAVFDRASGTSRGEQLVVLTGAEATVTIPEAGTDPVLSVNRDFSAPVVVETDRKAADLAFLSAHDDDPFARYEALQQLMLDTLVASASGAPTDHGPVIDAIGATLTDAALDPAFIGEAVLLPTESFVGDHLLVVDPEAIAMAREALRLDIATAHVDLWASVHAKYAAQHFEYSPAAKGRRRLRNAALGYLALADAESGCRPGLRAI